MRSEARRPRIIVDANIWLSYLLPARQDVRTVDRLVALIESERVVVAIPLELIRELNVTVQQKPYLARRISPERFDVFLEFLRAIGEMLPELRDAIPRVTRDPKDDYLIAAAILGDVDILVTGDADLLSLREHLERPRIMTAREIVEELDAG